MKRDVAALAARRFDALVVGAGIHGACIAWDAALRGLSVALVDRGDFGGGVSANSLKVIHGGLRYLQQLDLARMRESIRERSTWLRIAPDLVRPMPFVVPTRGVGRHGAAALGVALWLNDRIGADRNRGLDDAHTLPAGRLVSREELARLAPLAPREGASGGALWYDAQANDTERLTLAVVQAAAERGAVVANHVRVSGLRSGAGTCTGARAVDELTDRGVEIDARVTVVATGWDGLTGDDPRDSETRRGPSGEGGERMAQAINLVLRRRLDGPAFGVRVAASSPGDPGGSGTRFLFFVPWRQSTMVGTFYRLVPREEGAKPPPARVLDDAIERVRAACPALELRRSDVGLVHHGALPLGGGWEPRRALELLQHHRIVDHRRIGGPEGLVSVVGVKYTTGRLAAEQAVDLVCRKLGRGDACATAVTGLPTARPGEGGDPVAPGASVSRAQVVHAIREEMAVHLADLVLRRTGMGSQGCPPAAHLDAVSRLMAAELGWDEAARAAELAGLRRAYEPLVAQAEDGLAAGPGGTHAARD